MVDVQRDRFEKSMAAMVDEIDKTSLRQMQGDTHRCAAICCDDKNSTVESVYKCVEECGRKLNSANSSVHSELDAMKSRLERCIWVCNDSISTKMTAERMSPDEMAAFTQQFEKCATKCVDTHIESVPPTLKRIKNVLAAGH